MKKINTVAILLASMILVSCGGSSSSGNTNSTSETNTGPVNKIDNKNLRVDFKTVRKNAGNSDTPAKGETKILVLPVDLSDFPADELPGGKEAVRQDIHDTFFGAKEDTSWESFASFYDKSSKGQLKFSGEVLDWYRPKLSGAELSDFAKEGGATAAAAKISNEYLLDQKDLGEKHTEYDSDGDGYIDGFFMVYSAPQRATGADGKKLNDDLFWAFKSQTSNSPSVKSPFAHNFMWASYDFLYEAGYYENGVHVPYDKSNVVELGNKIANNEIKPDAHTFIHETGHMMGINDYYSYDAASGDWSAMGGIDMMDNNVGDHNSYTKWMWDWTAPYHVVNEGEFTLKPFDETNEFIMIDPNWNNNQTSEYLLIEYYRPKGLFEQDATHRYAGPKSGYPLFFDKPGVRVLHVDARLGSFTYSSAMNDYMLTSYVDYTSPQTSGNTPTKVDTVAQNSYSRTGNKENKDFKEIHLLNRNGVNTLKTAPRGVNADSSYLFQVGDSFGYDTFTNFKFNDGSVIDFKFEITAMTEEGVTFNFVRNN